MLTPCLLCGTVFNLRGSAKRYCCAECQFAASITVRDDGCWQWPTNQRSGYGGFRGQRAHRAGYQMFVGPIPEGLEVDHLCMNPSCVNPDHLEPVTHRENVLRSYRSRGYSC